MGEKSIPTRKILRRETHEKITKERGRKRESGPPFFSPLF